MIKTNLKLLVAILLLSSPAMAQKYMTKSGHIDFYSSTPMEDIEAHNKQVNAALDTKNGDFVFKVLIRSFQFEKALMQEHFNENYMESHEFPTATFQGKIRNLNDINFSTEGKYAAEITGKLTIHGVTRDIRESGTFTISKEGIQGQSGFGVRVKDYDIKIPTTVVGNISETIEVSVDVHLKPLK